MRLFTSGYCTSNQKIVNPNKPFKTVSFNALWGLFNITDIGWVMFDTGYSRHFFTSTQSFPDIIYRLATPVFINEHQEAKQILKRIGITPNEIKYIIISHFHADHIAGLKDFENAQFICSEDALNQVLHTNGFNAVKKGILKKLLPYNFLNRVNTIEKIADTVQCDAFGLEYFYFFNQTLLRLVKLPGHARGQLGFIYKKNEIQYFYATDAAWDKDAFLANILPSKIVKLFIDSYQDLAKTQAKLRAYQQANPDVVTLFTHCANSLKYVEHV